VNIFTQGIMDGLMIVFLQTAIRLFLRQCRQHILKLSLVTEIIQRDLLTRYRF